MHRKNILNMQNLTTHIYVSNIKNEEIYRKEGQKLIKRRSCKNGAKSFNRYLNFTPAVCNVMWLDFYEKKKSRIYFCPLFFSVSYFSLGERFIHYRI
jgi:hypothetical protein